MASDYGYRLTQKVADDLDGRQNMDEILSELDI